MNYQDYVIFDPKVSQVGPDILQVEFWRPEFCELVIAEADRINQYSSRSHDPVPGQELRVNLISPDLYHSFCKHWMITVQPLLEKFYHLPTSMWFHGWKIPFIIKYTPQTQTSLPLHYDDSLITGTVKLNNNYEGGDLVFPRYNFTNKDCPVGCMLLWPSGIQHVHLSTPVTRGTKYSWVAWTKTDPGQEGINYKNV